MVKIYAYELGTGDNVVRGFGTSLESVVDTMALVRDEIASDASLTKPPMAIYSFELSQPGIHQMCRTLNGDQSIDEAMLTNRTLVQRLD